MRILEACIQYRSCFNNRQNEREQVEMVQACFKKAKDRGSKINKIIIRCGKGGKWKIENK